MRKCPCKLFQFLTYVYQERRKKLGKSIKAQGMLIFDAFTGFRAKDFAALRKQWSEMNNVHLYGDPLLSGEDSEAQVPGGWSRDGQPQDAVHGFFHQINDAWTRVCNKWTNSVFLRAALGTMKLGSQGFGRERITPEQVFTGDVYSWEIIPVK